MSQYFAQQLTVGGGINTGVNPFSLADNQDIVALNVIPRPVGAYTQRPGSKTIYNLNTSDEVVLLKEVKIEGVKRLLAISKQSLFDLKDDEVKPVNGKIDGAYPVLSVVRDRVLIADGSSLKLWNVSQNILESQSALPKAAHVNFFKNRVYLSGDPERPFTLYASNILYPNDSVDSLSFISPENPVNDVDPSLADPFWINIPFSSPASTEIVLQEEFDNRIYLFTEDEAVFTEGGGLDGIVPVLVNEGPANPNAYAKSKAFFVYMGLNGIYRVVDNRVDDLHVPVIEYVKQSDRDKIRGFQWDNYLGFFIGDVKLYDYDKSQEKENVVILLDLLNNAWTIWSGVALSCYGISSGGQSRQLIAGKIDGTIIEFNEKYLTDDGVPIEVDLRTGIKYLDGLNTTDQIDVVHFFGRLTGAQGFIRGIGDKLEQKYTLLGDLSGTYAAVNLAESSDVDTPNDLRGYQLRIAKNNPKSKFKLEGYGFTYTNTGVYSS